MTGQAGLIVDPVPCRVVAAVGWWLVRPGRNLPGVWAQRGQHCQVGADGVGLALPAAPFAAGLLSFEHQHASGGQRPRQPDAYFWLAACTLR